MLTILVVLMALSVSVSPLSVTLTTITMSGLVAMLLFSMAGGCFTPSALLISFSSGMMIMFFYCSMFSTHEKKKKSISNIPMVLAMAGILMSTSSELVEGGSSSNPTQSLQQPFLILGMLLVMITMLSVNMYMMDPKKGMSQCY